MRLHALSVLILLLFTGCTSTPNSDSSGTPLVVDRNHPVSWSTTHSVEAAVEVDSCKTCHGADYLGGTVNVSCMTCHLSGPPFTIHTASWTNTNLDHRTFATIASWTTCANGNCHGVGLAGGSSGGANTGPSCLSGCHTTGNNAGQPDAPHGDYNPGTPANHGLAAKADMVYCRNCHGRPDNTFDGGFVTAILGDPSGISANCSSSACHPDATAHPTNWQGSNDAGGYTSSHRNNGVSAAIWNTSCALCHKVDGVGAGLMAGAPSCYSSTNTNANASTTSCHSGGPSSVGSHDATSFSFGSDGCDACHNSTMYSTAGTPEVVLDVHGSTCNLCHIDGSTGLGTSENGPHGDGDATKAAALVDFKTATCLTCHSGAGVNTLPDIHHDGTSSGAGPVAAVSGNCTYCHADPRPSLDATYSLGSPAAMIQTQLACKKCHTSGGNVYNNSYTPAATNASGGTAATNYATVQQSVIVNHSFATTIQNFAACLCCHLANVSTAYGSSTVKVNVFHARPLNWSNVIPTNDVNDTGSTDQIDVLRGAPGRESFRMFGAGSSYWALGDLRTQGWDLCGDGSKSYKGCSNNQSRWENGFKNNQGDWDNPVAGYTSRMTIPCGVWNDDGARAYCGAATQSVPHCSGGCP